jgi:hypothetical protein
MLQRGAGLELGSATNEKKVLKFHASKGKVKLDAQRPKNRANV